MCLQAKKNADWCLCGEKYVNLHRKTFTTITAMEYAKAMIMRGNKRFPLVLSLCCMLFVGCHGGNTAEDLLGGELLREIRKSRDLVAQNIQDDFVKKIISSMESSSVLVDVQIDELDTMVEVFVFDTNAPCNRGVGDFAFGDCLAVDYEGTCVFVSGRYLDMFCQGRSLSEEERKNVSFQDCLVREYCWRNGALVYFIPPLPSYEVTVVLDSM